MWKIIGYFTLGLFLILLGIYIEGALSLINHNYEKFEKYPTVFVGIGAAFAALLGVIISQFWQSFNIDKNIKSTQNNLRQQLSHQSDTFNKQLNSQKEQLILQHKNALEIKDKELNEQNNQKKYDELEQGKKELWLILLNLKRLLKLYLDETEKIAKNHIAQSCYEKISRTDYRDKISALEKKIFTDLDKVRDMQEEIELIEHTIDYLHNVKNVGNKESFTVFMAVQSQLMELAKKIIQTSIDYSNDTYNFDLIKANMSETDDSIIVKTLIDAGYEKIETITTQIWGIYHSDISNKEEINKNFVIGYESAYKNLLASIRESKIK